MKRKQKIIRLIVLFLIYVNPPGYNVYFIQSYKYNIVISPPSCTWLFLVFVGIVRFSSQKIRIQWFHFANAPCGSHKLYTEKIIHNTSYESPRSFFFSQKDTKDIMTYLLIERLFQFHGKTAPFL